MTYHRCYDQSLVKCNYRYWYKDRKCQGCESGISKSNSRSTPLLENSAEQEKAQRGLQQPVKLMK